MIVKMINYDSPWDIDGILACAFARSTKMMRFIEAIYNSDKSHYWNTAKNNPQFKSRLITGAHIRLQMQAIQALGIITASKTDENLGKQLLAQAERAFHAIAVIFDDYRGCKGAEIDILEAFGKAKLYKKSDDNSLHDMIAVFHYFCQKYNMPPLKNEIYKSMVGGVIDKINGCMHPFSERMDLAIMDIGIEKERDALFKTLHQLLGKGRSISKFSLKINGMDIGYDPQDLQLSALQPFFQSIWDFSQYDNIPMSNYEDIELTSREIRDLANTIIYYMIDKQKFDALDVGKLLLVGIIIRSFSKMYLEAVDIINEYSGIIIDSEKTKPLVSENARMKSKISELETSIKAKQEKLNEQQKEIDRLKKKIKEQEKNIVSSKEKCAFLESLLADEKEDEFLPISDNNNGEKKDALIVETIKNKKIKAVVFGGTPVWQHNLQELLPNFKYIPVENHGFDEKIIDNADFIIIQRNFLSHAQSYKIMGRVKKQGKTVIFCGNNIHLLLCKIANDILHGV